MEKQNKINEKTGEIIKNKRVFKGQSFNNASNKTIKTFKEVAEVVYLGDDKKDFVIKKKLVVAEEVNRSDYINSFSGDVGIQNILKKVALSGKDLGSVIEAGTFTSKQKGLVDISKMPDNVAEAFRSVEKGVAAFDKLPEDLKKKMSFDAFAKSVNKADIDAYIQAEVDKRLKNVKKENVESEVK